MKFFPLTLLTSVLFVAAPACALDFWHSSTTWANHGMCSAEFIFDSGGEEIKNASIEFRVGNASVLVVDAT